MTSYDGTFAALSARTGPLLWRHKLPYNTIGSPTVIGPYVYVADRGARAARQHGAFRLRSRPPGVAVHRRQVLDGDRGAGRLFVAGASRVYALQPVR